MIEKYLNTRYLSGGRGPDEFDCWGLVRTARHELFGTPLLPTCAGAHPGDMPAITAAVREVAGPYGLSITSRSPGAIATAWRGRLCVHVGLVVEADGREWILETDVGTGPCLTRPASFESRYTRVDYYAD